MKYYTSMLKICMYVQASRKGRSLKTAQVRRVIQYFTIIRYTLQIARSLKKEKYRYYCTNLVFIELE